MANRRGIVEEVLIPLLRQLDIVELSLSKLNNPQLNALFYKIKQDVQELKSLYQDADLKESKVVASFESVSRLVDDLLQSEKLQKPPPPPPPPPPPNVPESISEVQASQENEKAHEEDPTLPSAKFKEILVEDSLPEIVQVPSFSSNPSTFQVGETSGSTSTPSTSTPSNKEEPLHLNKLRCIKEEIAKIKEDLHLHEEDKKLSLPKDREAEDQAGAEKRREIEWEKILKESAALTHLSYRIENLDNQLKGCLFTFTVFQESEKIKKRLLIHWWIGEGLLTSSDGITAEKNGEICIEELVSKGLIETFHSKWSLEVVECRMYQWIYRMLMLSPSRNAYFSPSRRAHLLQTDEKLVVDESDEEQLVTLYNISSQYLRLEEQWLAPKKNLGVIQLGRWQDLPKYHIEVDSIDFLQQGLDKCIKLKYLSLRGISRITELPDSVDKLTKLVVLDLRACHNLEKLTSAVTSLKELTHLDVSECYLLEQMPKGIESLTKLQVLKGFVIGNARRQKRKKKSPCSLVELAKLTNLHKLSISMGRYSVISTDEVKALSGLSALKSLTIRWGVLVPSKRDHPTKGQEKTLKRKQTLVKVSVSLSLPPELEKLDLRCFPEMEFVDWISPEKLGQLKKLYIRGGELRNLHGSETGWKVEVLRLKYLKHLPLEWTSLHHAFPDLACLEVHSCGTLTSFPSEDEGNWMKRASLASEEGDLIWTKKNSRWSGEGS